MFEFIQELKAFISALSLFSLVDIYRNEFVQGSDWNPVFPCCLIRFENLDANVFAADGRSLKDTAIIIIYVATRFDPDQDAPSALELAESLYEALDGFEYEGSTVTQNNLRFVESAYGTDIYSIQITAR